jgi:hypothetical protein
MMIGALGGVEQLSSSTLDPSRITACQLRFKPLVVSQPRSRLGLPCSLAQVFNKDLHSTSIYERIQQPSKRAQQG